LPFTINLSKINVIPNFVFKKFFQSSTIRLKRLSNKERFEIQLEDKLKQILIGTILGDAYIRRFSNKSNTRIVFRQGLKNAEYLNHLYLLFQNYVLALPIKSIIVNKKTKLPRYNLSFATMSLPCFNEFFELFYLNGVKIVPKNIYNFLTPISLAYWIMGDGNYTGNGLKLNTNAFKVEEVFLLIDALEKNFSLKASINKTSIKDQFTIYT